MTINSLNSVPQIHHPKDHLGNIRNVLTPKDGVVKEVQHTAYYPFGGIIADLSSDRGVQNRFYNGKELDYANNLYWLDYGARQYDPTRGQFTTPDPLAEKYYGWNMYGYCGNNPLSRIDLTGMDWYQTSKGNYYWNPMVHSQEDLQEGYTYIGESYYDKSTNMAYRSDGTVLCPDEASGLTRMQLQNEYSKNSKDKYGKEQFAVVLENGSMLVMPDNWNNVCTSYLAPGSDLTGETFTSSIGNTYNVVAHIHTHTTEIQKRSVASGADGDFAASRKNLPCFVIQYDGELFYSIQPAMHYKDSFKYIHYQFESVGYIKELRKRGLTFKALSQQIVKHFKQ